MNSLNFDFHGIAGVQVNTSDAFASSFFVAEYAGHLVHEIPATLPRVVLNFNLPGRTWGSLTPYSHKLLARWSYAMELAENNIILNVTGNRFAVPMVHHMMVHSSLRYLVSYHGAVLFHSGGLALNGRSLLFTGRSGVGKTTTTSVLLSSQNQKWSLHADDYVFLSQNIGSLAYLTRAHVYQELLAWLPALSRRLSVKERVLLKIFGYLRNWSHEQIKWPVRLGLDRLWPGHEICKAAQPAALVLLSRGSVDEPVLSQEEPGPDLVAELVAMNFHEARHFISLLQKQQLPPETESQIEEWREREKTILTSWIRKVSFYRMVLPRKPMPREMLSHLLADRLSTVIPGR